VIDVQYNQAESLILAKSAQRSIGRVTDSNTRQLLSALQQEGDLELQIQVLVEQTTARESGRRLQISKILTVCVQLIIIVYGPIHLFEDVGEFFQDNDCYLQEPRGCDRNVRYRNPHCISGLDHDTAWTLHLEPAQDECEQTASPVDLLTGLETEELLPEAEDPPGLETPLYK
jgi:SWI/SNF-related matrix-associated actin-dependent regulator of chromatin subfamily A3